MPYPITLLLAVALLYATGLGAQGQSLADRQVIGKWALDYPATLEAMPQEKRDVYQGMQATSWAEAKSYYEGRQFVFFGNGTYQMSLSNGSKSMGSWSMSSDGRTLALTDSATKEAVTYSVTMDNGSLVLHMEGLNSQHALFRELYLRPE